MARPIECSRAAFSWRSDSAASLASRAATARMASFAGPSVRVARSAAGRTIVATAPLVARLDAGGLQTTTRWREDSAPGSDRDGGHPSKGWDPGESPFRLADDEHAATGAGLGANAVGLSDARSHAGLSSALSSRCTCEPCGW
jgi:hypothetical protein